MAIRSSLSDSNNASLRFLSVYGVAITMLSETSQTLMNRAGFAEAVAFAGAAGYCEKI